MKTLQQKEPMSILVVGSVAFDSIETPEGRRDRCLGGAATYFALAASYFTNVRVIAVVKREDQVPAARLFGASEVVRITEGVDAVAAVRRLNGGKGFGNARDGYLDDAQFLQMYPPKKGPGADLSGPAIEVSAEDLAKAYKDDAGAADAHVGEISRKRDAGRSRPRRCPWRLRSRK